MKKMFLRMMEGESNRGDKGGEMNESKWRSIWKEEEEAAHIHGWNFSHIDGRYEEENDLPWD